MASELQALSDREKDALRLLADGHDAKSAARQLGISVHAVNERLRSSRRKLGVSSSREAARLVAASEREGPKYSVDKRIGVAGSTPDGEGSHARKGRNRAFALTLGGIAVSLAIMIAILAATRSSTAAPGPLPNWNVQATMPKTPARQANHIYLARNRLLWNGNEASEASIREFLAVETQMSPQPLTILSYGSQVAPGRIQSIRQLIDDTLRCKPATCLEVTSASDEASEGSPNR